MATLARVWVGCKWKECSWLVRHGVFDTDVVEGGDPIEFYAVKFDTKIIWQQNCPSFDRLQIIVKGW